MLRFFLEITLINYTLGCSVIEKVFSFEFDQTSRGVCTRGPDLDLIGRVLSDREK